MPGKSPLITIITPTYNAERVIGKCIASVQSQNFTGYEHVIIDGLSSDSTIEKVRQLQAGHPNIKLVVEKDKGVFDAMNKGIQLSRSAWLYFLGADDFMYDESVLNKIAGHISGSDAHIIYGDVYFEQFGKTYDGAFDIEKILKRNICHQAIFYRAAVFKTMGLFDINYRLVADYEFNLRCWLNRGIKHQYVPLIIAYYAEGGISSVQRDALFVKDYPSKIIAGLLAGNWVFRQRVFYLSVIFRKIAQRYPFKILLNNVFKKDQLMLRLWALLLMLLSFPFYLLKSGKLTFDRS